MKPLMRVPTAWLLIGGILIVVVAVQILFSGQAVTSVQAKGATIVFSADKAAVWADGECVQVRWNAQGISEIYYNDQGTTGIGEATYCVQTSTQRPTLRVVFQDGSEETFQLFVRTLADRTEIWVVIGAAIACFGAAILTTILSSMLTKPLTDARSNFERLLMGIGSMIILFVWTFLLLEGVLRAYFNFFGNQEQKIAYVYSRDEINQLNAGIIPMPTVDYVLSPNAPGVNALGYRGEMIDIPKPDSVFRIIAAGDSSTFGMGSSPIDSYPAQLQDVLRNEYGYTNVEVVNAGVGGYTTFQIVANMATRYLELEPDMVILYEAGNDAGLRGTSPECYAGINPLRGLNPQGTVATLRSSENLSPSVVVRFFGAHFGWLSNPSQLDALLTRVPIDCTAENQDENFEYIPLNPPTYFRRNVMSMAGIAQAHDIQLVLTTWAYLVNAPNLHENWKQAVAENNDILREIATTENLPLIEYEQEAPDDESMWVDFLHMNPDGMRSQAEVFAAYLHAQGLIPRPS